MCLQTEKLLLDLISTKTVNKLKHTAHQYLTFIYSPLHPSSMARLEFEDIKFEEITPGSPDSDIKLVFLKLFQADIPRKQFEKIGDFKINTGVIDFPNTSEKQLSNKFNNILSSAFHSLKNKISGNPAVYVHQNSNIPLIGNLYFGIVDRGTNIIEIKPITSCNIDCAFCSVSEGGTNNKRVDYVVEEAYLIRELNNLIKFKSQTLEDDQKLDIFINPRGEPLLYAPIVDLIQHIRDIPQVRHIAIITNGTLLSKNLIDRLIEAGMNQIDISINAIDEDKAKELAGANNQTTSYNINNVLGMTDYIAKTKKVKIIIAPVWLKRINDNEIPKIISFAKKIGAEIGIQNYLSHARGKKITDQVSWEAFGKQLKEWEKVTKTKLMFEDHSSFKTKELDKPFKKGDIIKVEIVCKGKLNHEVLATAQDRTISVVDCDKTKGIISVKILKDKNNTFVGKPV